MEMVPFKQGKEPKDLILLIRPAWSWSLKGDSVSKTSFYSFDSFDTQNSSAEAPLSSSQPSLIEAEVERS